MKNIYSILIILVLNLACQSKKEEALPVKSLKDNVVELTKKQLDNSKIKVGSLTQSPLSTTIKVNGKITLAPNAMASVSMPLGGYIKNIKVMPGMVIKKGQILVGNTMTVTLACDHRTVDGATGAQFLQTFKAFMENPVTMLA